MARYSGRPAAISKASGHSRSGRRRGSSRDWAATSTRLPALRAVIGSGFERIHKSNLLGKGAPASVPGSAERPDFRARRHRAIRLVMGEHLRLRQHANLDIERRDRRSQSMSLLLRIDTALERPTSWPRDSSVCPRAVARTDVTDKSN
jgi:aconitase A